MKVGTDVQPLRLWEVNVNVQGHLFRLRPTRQWPPWLKVALKMRIALHLNSASDLRGIICRDHTVLPATRHKWTRPALTPASKLVLDLPTPEGWKAELTYPAMHRPEIELTTTTPPSNHWWQDVNKSIQKLSRSRNRGGCVRIRVESLPPLKEVMFSVRSVCLFVCLSVRRITEKVVNEFWRNFLESRAWPRDQWFQFWWRSGSSSGSRSPKSEIRIHWIIELLTDFDEISRRAGVWPRAQLITFWWQSASLSGSGCPFRITIQIREELLQ